MTAAHPITLGTIGGTRITADLLNKGTAAHSWDVQKVRLTSSYTTVNPPGYPNRPPAGQAAKFLGPLGTLPAGATRAFHAHEAAAIVAAGGGTYA
jgi:hypothetical protein